MSESCVSVLKFCNEQFHIVSHFWQSVVVYENKTLDKILHVGSRICNRPYNIVVHTRKWDSYSETCIKRTPLRPSLATVRLIPGVHSKQTLVCYAIIVKRKCTKNPPKCKHRPRSKIEPVLGPLHMIPVTGLARLPGRNLSVHMGNFSHYRAFPRK